jgi:ABC-type Na+ efflux pump permease subunit
MRKILVIAVRDYNAAVRSKAFLVSLFLLPVLMGGSFAVQLLFKDIKDTKPKDYAVLDRTPDHEVFQALAAAADQRNQQTQPAFRLDRIKPAGDPSRQRLELSELVRRREYHGFLEVGEDVCKLPASDHPPAGAEDRWSVTFQSNNPLTRDFPAWAEREINKKVRDLRAGKDLQRVVQAVPFQPRGLSRLAADGTIVDGPPVNFIASFLVPVILVMMMFMMIFVGATPLMQGVVEEKMQRISEVLLGSVPPFQLMLGKLLGTVGVATTLAAVYLGSGFAALGSVPQSYGLGEFLTLPVLGWFLTFLTLGVLMYGSLFVAIGSACTSTQETQTLLMPVMLLAMIPLFVMTQVILEPDSALSVGMSLVPTATPMLMVVRVAVPPGVPWWQPVLGVVLVLLTTLLLVWAAGRIFRVGILMQGKGANLAEMMKWVFRG